MTSTAGRLLTAAVLAFTVLTATAARAAQDGTRSAIFAGGCFWCVEADFDKVGGVVSTTSGYIGGSAEDATYKTVSRGGTGHYEAVRIEYDPDKVSYERLLHVYWRNVDPTDAGGQFCDRGPSYRTAIFATSERQKKLAEASKEEARRTLGRSIVTPIRMAGEFYEAEAYHQNYYEKNPVRYKIYRFGCGRDSRLEELWGEEAYGGIHK